MATTPEPHALELLRLLQGNDSAYPTGAYAHSFGLEGLVQAGVVCDAESLEAYLRDHAVPALVHLDLPLVVQAHAAAARGALPDVLALDALCHALRGARELREASVRVGAQRLRMAVALGASEALGELEGDLTAGRWQGHLPVAYGAVCALQGLSVESAVTAYAYQQLSGAVVASLKLLRVGQLAVQQVLTRVLESAAPQLMAARAIVREDIGWFAPLVDIASAQHETAYTRLFIS